MTREKQKNILLHAEEEQVLLIASKSLGMSFNDFVRSSSLEKARLLNIKLNQEVIQE